MGLAKAAMPARLAGRRAEPFHAAAEPRSRDFLIERGSAQPEAPLSRRS